MKSSFRQIHAALRFRARYSLGPCGSSDKSELLHIADRILYKNYTVV